MDKFLYGLVVGALLVVLLVYLPGWFEPVDAPVDPNAPTLVGQYQAITDPNWAKFFDVNDLEVRQTHSFILMRNVLRSLQLNVVSMDNRLKRLEANATLGKTD